MKKAVDRIGTRGYFQICRFLTFGARRSALSIPVRQKRSCSRQRGRAFLSAGSATGWESKEASGLCGDISEGKNCDQKFWLPRLINRAFGIIFSPRLLRAF